MAKKKDPVTFEVKIQNHGNDGRKTIEIPKDVRENFDVGKTVKVVMRELG